MLLTEILKFALRYWFVVIPAVITGWLLKNKYNRGLNKYPGHWLAAYTDWWRFWDVWHRKTEKTHLKLHRELGDVIRLGPNTLSFADPKAIKVIYGLNKGFTKSEFYPVQQAVSKGQRLPSLFSTTDEDYHSKYRRCVNNAFAMSSLVSFEPLVNKTINVFLDQTGKIFASTGKSCNFNQWLQFFAFDVIGDLTWSRRIGFVEQNEDVDGIVKFIGDFLSYAAPVGQMPLLDLVFKKNPIFMLSQKWGLNNTIFPATRFALARSAERAGEMDKVRETGLPPPSSKGTTDNPGGIDLLTRFTQAQHAHPEFMTDREVLTACVSMVFAGSETTAISLSTVFYMLVTHPRVYQKLMEEIENAVRDGGIEPRETGTVSWGESQKLPYLDAVIQECFRVHPAAGLIVERVVPKQGIEICGRFVPGGTIVGCNAWVLHRRPEIFGEDVDVFRPERWLEADAAKLRDMKATMFQFGAGARTCIGKNISLLEIYKLVPSFLRRFEISLVDPTKPWRLHNAWFVRQLDFNVRFTARRVQATV
ncbi:benzoate 4-monooxygenase cytochrome-like protein P450 [Patellaria atrata CBS 101060]|uniref:Benzoate 4-monooxygenase cytochrome-like protein P450 n=1 Tax=Patellaria atrata CBS 101060 TaxID=1346257 RepID=A0A9P4S816_9PEZI|nr:benzoate 4-monooxygenase cytochrome-like protein P450 [Patellaria atrata CBS 101060]